MRGNEGWEEQLGIAQSTNSIWWNAAALINPANEVELNDPQRLEPKFSKKIRTKLKGILFLHVKIMDLLRNVERRVIDGDKPKENFHYYSKLPVPNDLPMI